MCVLTNEIYPNAVSSDEDRVREGQENENVEIRTIVVNSIAYTKLIRFQFIATAASIKTAARIH